MKNERLCGKVQVHLNKIINNDQEIDLENITDDPHVLGYAFNVPKIPDDPGVSVEARQKQLDTEMQKLDYNLTANIVKASNDPYIYPDFLFKLGIVEHTTLLAYSNSGFCKKGLNYYKLRDTQNKIWALENYKKGVGSTEAGYYEQAINSFNYALEYDPKMEKA